jgi:polyisoprenoid-binding protein YceI
MENPGLKSVPQGKSSWRLDREHSSVEFSIKKLFFFTVSGKIGEVDGSLVLDEDSVSGCSVQASIKAKNINTGNQQRDQQLRAAGFLDVTNFPQIEFQSSEVGPGRDRDMLSVKGVVTIKGTTRDVFLHVTEVDRSKSPNGEEVVYYVGETEINRFDFGVSGWRGVIAPKLKVVINVQANRRISD